MRKADDDLFIEKFKHIQNHLNEESNYMFETYGEEWDFVKSHSFKNVWTVIDGEKNSLWLCKGFHIVNRFGYMVCEVEWIENDKDYKW